MLESENKQLKNNNDMEMTLVAATNAAKRLTKNAADVKAWRITRKIDREFQQVAGEWVKENGGYMIATPRELKEAYPALVTWMIDGPDEDKKFVWAISSSRRFDIAGGKGRSYSLNFCPIR